MQDSKYEKLKEILTNLGSLVVAFSGGTDSTLLLKVAHDVLGDKVVAMTAVSASLPAADRLEARQIACQIGASHIWLNQMKPPIRTILPTPPTAVSSASRKPMEN